MLVSESAPGKQAHSNRRKWGEGGSKEKREVFAGGRDKGAPHAEARARSGAVLFMLLLSQVLIVPAVHHFQLPAWPKQCAPPPSQINSLVSMSPFLPLLPERSVNKAGLVLDAVRRGVEGTTARMSGRAKGVGGPLDANKLPV